MPHKLVDGGCDSTCVVTAFGKLPRTGTLADEAIRRHPEARHWPSRHAHFLGNFEHG